MISHLFKSLQSLRAGILLVAVLLSNGAPMSARAQSGLGDIVYTVGTTARDSHNQDWAYILWQGTQLGLVSNRVFAVYCKPGVATNNAPYTRLSLVSLQTDARVIEPLLQRAANLGDDIPKLQEDLGALFGSFIPPSSITRAEQLSAVIRGSVNQADSYQNLMLLARNHAGINMALGFADAELMSNGTNTYEVRVFDPSTSKDLAVIGRVTIEAGHPTVLPPPGPPVLVPENSPKGDLNLKFRWGTPDSLRRLGLVQFGYNLYRVEKNYAASQGWTIANPPTNSVLQALIMANPALAKRVNKVPLTPNALFTADSAALVTLPGDTNTFFIMDDDGRGRPGYVNHSWTNGAQFVYYVAARDVLGRDGLFSTGLVATVCDRMPSLPPTEVHVVNDYQYDPGTLTATQGLRVNWQQNLRTNDVVVAYRVYRWTNTLEMNALSGDPDNNCIATVPHIPGATNNTFLDTGYGSPTAQNAYGKTFWYTVRALDAGACGPNFSAPAGPAYGVLRQRVGPGAGSGFIEFNCLSPVVNYLGTGKGRETNDSVNFDFVLTCLNQDSRIEWAQFVCVATYTQTVGRVPTVTAVTNTFGPLYFFGNPQVTALWTPPHDPNGNGLPYDSITTVINCRAGMNNGKISDFNVQQVAPPVATLVVTEVFQAMVQTIRTTAGANNRSDCHEHDAGGGLAGTNNISIQIIPSPGSKEYRLFRRVDGGPLSMLCSGAITNLLQLIKCFEDAPPVNGGTLCYYLQLLDENGNPSPLTPLGCVDTAPNTPLPAPVLAKITPIGTDPTSAGMTLSWFCPPYGVDRFEVRVGALPTLPSAFALSSQLLVQGVPPMQFTNNVGTNVSLLYFAYITPKVGPGFGNNGAQFTVPCKVEVGKQYYVTVRALSPHNDPGDFSNFQPFMWVPSNSPPLQVPWPERPLPSTNANFLGLAFYLSATNPAPTLRSASPAGNAVLVGLGQLPGREFNLNLPPIFYGTFDPNSLIGTNALGESLFPCMLYRYQVANANFPVVSGDVIQVSPLMENIAYQLSPTGNQTTNTIIHDPFIAVTALYPGVYLWLRDMQPQISGASYKYIIVKFNPVTHEIDQLIPTNEVLAP
jgi:hypothetical protein